MTTFTRMLRCCLLIVVSLAAVVGTTPAQHAPAAQPEPAPPEALAPLAWMVGGTWVGEEIGADGSPLRVLMKCRWSDTRNAILFDLAYDSAGKRTPQYDGMYLWHPGRKRLTLWQVNRRGQVAEGELQPSGNTFDQLVRVDHPDGRKHFLKVRFQLLDKDTFHFKGFFRLSEDAAWQDAVEVVYRRQ